MHKVKLVSVKNKTPEYKEECENAGGKRCKSTSLWVYPKSVGSVCCDNCKGTLRGVSLMDYQRSRILYHREK
jgi:hypothetical protein